MGMRGMGSVIGKIGSVGLLMVLAGPTAAGDPLFMLTHGDQDALVLGTVVAATPEMLTFQPAVEIPGQRIGLPMGKPQPIKIRQTDCGRLSWYQSPLAVGDRALVSLRAEGDQYRLAWGAFHVSSLELATLQVAKVEQDSDLIALQWYLNSCAQENEFSFDGSALGGATLGVQSGGQQRLIGKRVGPNWVELGHPTTCGVSGVGFWGAWIWLAVPIGLLGGGLWADRTRKGRSAN
jgi:hypothetical protein